MRRYNLTISNVMKTYSNEYIARVLADSGLKVDTINSMLHFAWQFAINMQQLSSNPESVKKEYALLLNKAHFHALFFPISPGPEATHRVPEHWINYLGNIIKCRHRRAQIALLREQNLVIKGTKLFHTPVYPASMNDLHLHVGSLNVSNNEPIPSSGDSALPSEDTDMISPSRASGSTGNAITGTEYLLSGYKYLPVV
ncbi:hypothetical protein L218DRAFT_990203 [Marasmius fiardii PR-910]|nr:hypothetical protein L218DRAFT_990203 [Marasmius fiardii PR-910]